MTKKSENLTDDKTRKNQVSLLPILVISFRNKTGKLKAMRLTNKETRRRGGKSLRELQGTIRLTSRTWPRIYSSVHVRVILLNRIVKATRMNVRPSYARKSLSASKSLTPRRPLTAKGKWPEDDPEKHWEIERFGPTYLKWGTKVGF